MPTYAFSTAKKLTAEQRSKLVESITAIHSEETGAPRYFVQVIFYDLAALSHFVGGEAASADHIWVRAEMRSGRTPEVKARILRRIMRETSQILRISQEIVWVYIQDIPGESVAEYGAILPKPGGEAEWLAALPSALREKLQAIG